MLAREIIDINRENKLSHGKLNLRLCGYSITKKITRISIFKAIKLHHALQL